MYMHEAELRNGCVHQSISLSIIKSIGKSRMKVIAVRLTLTGLILILFFHTRRENLVWSPAYSIFVSSATMLALQSDYFTRDVTYSIMVTKES